MKNISIGDKVEFVDTGADWRDKDVENVGRVIGKHSVKVYGRRQTLFEIDVGTNVSKLVCSFGCTKV